MRCAYFDFIGGNAVFYKEILDFTVGVRKVCVNARYVVAHCLVDERPYYPVGFYLLFVKSAHDYGAVELCQAVYYLVDEIAEQCQAYSYDY